MAEPKKSFGEQNFGGCDLGDERRSQRLPQLADEMHRHPGGSLPEKLSRQRDLDSFYRLCEADEVTHAAVIEQHRQKTLQYLQASEDFVLAISDATELDYTTHHKVAENLGQIGKGTARWPWSKSSSQPKPNGKESVDIGFTDGHFTGRFHQISSYTALVWFAGDRR